MTEWFQLCVSMFYIILYFASRGRRLRYHLFRIRIFLAQATVFLLLHSFSETPLDRRQIGCPINILTPSFMLLSTTTILFSIRTF